MRAPPRRQALLPLLLILVLFPLLRLLLHSFSFCSIGFFFELWGSGAASSPPLSFFILFFSLFLFLAVLMARCLCVSVLVYIVASFFRRLYYIGSMFLCLSLIVSVSRCFGASLSCWLGTLFIVAELRLLSILTTIPSSIKLT